MHKHKTWLVAILAAIGLLLGSFLALSGNGAGASEGSHQGFSDRHPRNIGGMLTRNPDCKLRVPENPLTAQGLATPYVLSSAGVTCSEADADTAAFVQATILDPATGALSVYHPVVRDAGAALLGPVPPVPALPPHAVITIWTGFNGNVLRLTGPGHDDFIQFPQQSYSNSPKFFRQLNRAIGNGLVTVPGLGMANDGQPCPSSRDFSIVDQDQSDNNPQSYPAYGVRNASDEKTLNTVDKVLGCSTWKAADLDPTISGTTGMSPSGPLQEAQAAAWQQAPVALIPGGDPFAQRNGTPSLFLQNLLRAQVDQPFTGTDGTTEYCNNLLGTGEPRLKLDQAAEAAAPNTLPFATNLADQLAFRYQQAWEILGCKALTGMDSPITAQLDGNGVVIPGSVTYK